jgi:predicted nucleic acid-binding protein
MKPVARSTCDTLSPRHQHHQQCHEAYSIRGSSHADGGADNDLFIPALTVGEIRRGLLEKSAGKKRALLEAWFVGPEGPQALFAGRVLAFDEKASLIWARLMADGTARGRPLSALDMIIAAIAEVNGCVVVTDNEKDFTGLKFVNPLRARKTD